MGSVEPKINILTVVTEFCINSYAVVGSITGYRPDLKSEAKCGKHLCLGEIGFRHDVNFVFGS